MLLKSTFRLKKLKTLRSKVTEIFMNLRKKFCEYPPRLVNTHWLKRNENIKTMVLVRFHKTKESRSYISEISGFASQKVRMILQNVLHLTKWRMINIKTFTFSKAMLTTRTVLIHRQGSHLPWALDFKEPPYSSLW